MQVMAKEQIFTVLQRHHAQLHQLGVRRYGLFGSFVRDEQNTESDVDMLIEFEPHQKNFQHFMQLAFFLEDVLGRKVDIVTPESLSPHIGPNILREVTYVTVSA
ncbi:MAG: nucleotidyltransferase [Chloroflexi bacterium AL-W]|nr:nucleotidyltransferase [Chloroflexi bacterium AL-N1]NOK65855.1 nucleotidyltransferase [Chloroflexi bacterium AL-N10]NOK74204.1 nucleotidyltransferase [Chloroflexi bacterium AL-N5]NOK80888.1 nucleotidyltransferase [Chloroflexi bacterium AL-W]NOK88462.1 nucleotidyltransferase [Chloroflexi bacterium AL-N15]